MAEKKKEKANLENIAKEGYSFMVNDASDKETDITKKVPMWIQDYMGKIYGTEQAEATYEILRRDPLHIAPLISQAKTQHETNLITEVKKAPKEVAENIHQNYAIGIASQFFGDTGYKTLKNAIENNGDIRTAFSSAFEGDLWKSTVAGAIQEAINGAANGYMQRATKREIAKNLCNEEGIFNANKSATYITSNIKKQDVSTQNTSYKELGIAYTQTKLYSA